MSTRPYPSSKVPPVGSQRVVLTAAPTLDTSAYVSGDILNGTIITFTDAVADEGATGTITALVLVDKDVQSKAGELWLFDTAVTIPAANAAWSVSDADALHCLAVIPFGTTYYASALNSVTVANALDVPFKAASGTKNIYGVLVTRSTPTYTASGLQLALHVTQD